MAPREQFEKLDSSFDFSPEALGFVLRTQLDLASGDADIATAMEKILACALAVLPASTGAVVELCEGNEMVYRACTGSLAHALGLRLKRQSSFSGLCVERGEALSCRDCATDDRVDKLACARLNVHSMLGAPLRLKQKSVGLIKVVASKTDAFTDSDLKLLMVLSISLSTVFANSKISLETDEALSGALSASQLRYRKLLESLPQLVWTALPSGESNYFSKQWIEYTGLAEASHLGMNWLQVVHNDDRQRVVDGWLSAVKCAGIYNTQYRIRRFDGVYEWFKSRGVPIYDDFNRITYWFGTCTNIEDQKRIEVSLQKALRAAQEGQAMLDAILEYAPTGITLTRADGELCKVSRYAQRTVGLHIQGDATSNLADRFANWQIYDPNTLQVASTDQWPIIRSLQKREMVEGEVWMARDAQGEFIPFLCNAGPIFDKEGELLGGVTIWQNISELMDREKRLQESEALLQSQAEQLRLNEARLKAIFEHSNAGLALLEAKPPYRVVLTNRYFQKLWPERFANQDIVGRALNDIAPGLESFGIYQIIQEIVQAKKGQGVNAMPYDFLTGDRHYWNWNVEPVIQGGQVEYLALLAVDVTQEVRERERAQKFTKEAQRARAELQAIIDGASGTIVFAKDREGRYLMMNRYAEELTGLKVEEIVGKFVQDLVPSKLARQALSHDEEVLRTNQPFTAVEPVTTPRGEERILLTTRFPLHDETGETYAVCGISTDITAIKHTEKALQEAVVARDQFLSIASHELKTPISSLKLQVQLAKRNRDRGDTQVYAKERVDHLLDQTDRQLDRLVRLIEDMLDISRIRAGQMDINKIEIEAGELLSEVVKNLAPSFQEAKTLVTFGIDESIRVCWDRDRIEQVITNLLTNAIRYGNHRPVHIELKSTPLGLIRLSVRDHGMGVAPEAVERIFNRFERAISASEISGLGLGLFITRQIVEAHGGRIWVESDGLGQGSNFVAELPTGCH